MNRRAFLALVATMSAGAALAQSSAPAPAETVAGTLAIRDPWSRATPGGARVGAGYVTIENRGGEPDRLLSAESEVSGGAEVHETVMAGGVARMSPTGPLAVSAKGRLELKPGGHHLMLTDLKRPLKEGERFTATLVFERAGRVPLTFVVRGLGAGAEAHHHH